MAGTFRGSIRWRSQWSGCEKHADGCGDGRTSLPQAMAPTTCQQGRSSNWSGFLRKVVKVRRFTSCIAGDGTASLRAGGIDSTVLLFSFGRGEPFSLRVERGFERGQCGRGRSQRLRTVGSSDGKMRPVLWQHVCGGDETYTVVRVRGITCSSSRLRSAG